ncbi:MAG TPA: Ig-like domain-containing protein [Gemmatimonadales bacterium]|nr:Ig-like domain-containing protein [Gemmatimonadales bacterium]
MCAATLGLAPLAGGACGDGTTGASDTTAPTVRLTAPAAGDVRGSVTVAAAADDDVGVAGVLFQLDGQPLGAEDTAAPYATTWDAAAAVPGPHTLTAVARDAAGNRTTSAAVAVTVVRDATTGTIRVVVATTGGVPDPDGYAVALDGGTPRAVAANGTIEFASAAAGAHTLGLAGLAPNCRVEGEHPRTVAVTAGAVAEVAVTVRCPTGGGAGLIAYATDKDGDYEIYVADVDGGEPRRLTQSAGDDLNPVWSPDGTKIAFASYRDGATNAEIYVAEADGSNPRRLTNDSGRDWEPAWSPDGTKIAFSSQRDGNFELYVMNADGTDQVRLTNTSAQEATPVWSPDGSRIAFEYLGTGSGDIYVMAADGSNRQRLTTSGSMDALPAWSPDGTRLAFASERDGIGNFEIYVMNADGSSQTRLTNSPAEDYGAGWSPDGTRLVFVSHRDGTPKLWMMNADGSAAVLWMDAAGAEDPAWHP